MYVHIDIHVQDIYIHNILYTCMATPKYTMPVREPTNGPKGGLGSEYLCLSLFV